MLRIRKFEVEGTHVFEAAKIPGAFHASNRSRGPSSWAHAGRCATETDDRQFARTAIPSATGRI